MGTVSFLFDQHIEPENLPWYNLPSIAEHIQRHLDDTGELTEQGETLPDEQRRFKEGELRWIAGGKDGTMGHHFGGGSDTKKAQNLAMLLRDVAKKNSLSKKVEVYNALLEDDLLSYIDPLLDLIQQKNISPEPQLHEFGRWLAREGHDRGPVKFAIALLGVLGNSDDLPMIMLLAKHEEFTLYAAVAISRLLDDPVPQLWELAKYVHGWGRIQLVERLSGTENADIKDWLLREGYKNSIMYEYLAYICATTGDLKSALSAEIIDDELLASAGELIESLILGGPAEDIFDYKEAPAVVKGYLTHLEPRAQYLEEFLTVHTIYDYLVELKESWPQSKKQGWTFEIRNTLLQTAQRIIQRPIWAELVHSKLSSQDNIEFHTASRAAEVLGIDTWEKHWERLHAEPLDSGRWYEVMRKANDERIKEIVAFTLDSLPLEQVTTGPSNAMGVGEEYMIHRCLDAILQDLGKYPGEGEFLLEAGLKSPVTRNRNLALRALSQWGREHWTLNIEGLLQHALSIEPDEDVQERIRQVLDGESIE